MKPYVWAMTLLVLLYSYYILSTDIILGVSDTAPFSGWSFGRYLGDSALLAMLVTLLILAATFSSERKKAGILTEVTGFPEKKRFLIKGLIIGGYFLMVNLLSFLMGCVFMNSMFGEVETAKYFLCWILVVLPSLSVVLGWGEALGRKSPVFVYLLMSGTLLAAFTLRAYGLDLSGGGYYETASAGLKEGSCAEPAFHVSAGYLICRMFYFVCGVAGMVLCVLKSGCKDRIEKDQR